ncbi:preprotein translocase subunit SecE [uncultured Desulfobacter sp.]|uniref:preprotein translocase subunit SecE n=1 Tax=uncultured Desulfobacter sp. TaxID=240139 RepID=UPI002AABA573|nr:preprotein translocase subunit SecE [uncultured Desulfobacter sp.]
MSRLQKKKPQGEKRKRLAEGEDEMGVAVKSTSAVRPTQSVSGVKPERSLVQPGEETFITRAMEFFREVKVELKKVIWPTRKQTTGTTVVVIIFVFIVAVFLGIFDYSLSRLVQVVLT